MKILWKDKFKEKDKIVYWIREWFDTNSWNKQPIKGLDDPKMGNPSKAIIPISGDKDSAVTAALCAEALGRNRVIGVILRDKKMRQEDLADARKVVELLEINKLEFNISTIEEYVDGAFASSGLIPNARSSETTEKCTKMAILYSTAKKINNSYIACTVNASDAYIGNTVKYGDLAGDFAPLIGICETLVMDIGRALSYTMPEFMTILENDRYDNAYVDIKENLHDISYEFLDEYLFNDEHVDAVLCDMIDSMHEVSEKSKPYPNISTYPYAMAYDIVENEDGEEYLSVYTMDGAFMVK